jgi:hypothetical protein
VHIEHYAIVTVAAALIGLILVLALLLYVMVTSQQQPNFGSSARAGDVHLFRRIKIMSTRLKP